MTTGTFVFLFYELCRSLLQKKWLSSVFCDWGSCGGSLGEALWKPVRFGGSCYTSASVFLGDQGEDSETTRTFYNIKRDLGTENGNDWPRGRICVRFLEF